MLATLAEARVTPAAVRMSSHRLVEDVTPGLKPRPTYWKVMYTGRVALDKGWLTMYIQSMRDRASLDVTRQGAQ